ncbi:hypothetical protein ANANG_G00101470 [Anguilla anguilla]|uniref:Uncharacterized protein n=1 Tax=Anguilla anguilla TaxID=7936 RepID=A0A9D3MGS5_ANGAN|nr:hypothetical protein ANANG_G00101470 [Anguilla anguilla]
MLVHVCGHFAGDFSLSVVQSAHTDYNEFLVLRKRRENHERASSDCRECAAHFVSQPQSSFDLPRLSGSSSSEIHKDSGHCAAQFAFRRVKQ